MKELISYLLYQSLKMPYKDIEKKRQVGRKYQKEHPERMAASAAKWRAAHPGRIERWRQHKIAQGLCVNCGKEPLAENSKSRCRSCLNKVKNKFRSAVIICLNHYGNQCVCCGEKELSFLTLDHINEDGAKHRKEIKSALSSWLVHNNFPVEYHIQILCWNCQWGKHLNGICPHQNS